MPDERERMIDIRKYCPVLEGLPARPFGKAKFLLKVSLKTLVKDEIDCPYGEAKRVQLLNTPGYNEQRDYPVEFPPVPFVSYDEVDGYVPRFDRVQIMCYGCALLPQGFDRNMVTKKQGRDGD